MQPKKSLFYCLGLLCFTAVANAQKAPDINPKEYNLQKNLVFEDNFDDDKNGWLKEEAEDSTDTDTSFVNSAETKIAKGYLKYDNRSKSGVFAAGIETNIDFNRDFEIEIKALVFYASDDYAGVGVLFWGRDSAKNATYLYFNNYQYFEMVDCNCNDWKNCKGKGKNTKNQNLNDFNKITIRHIGKYYYFFLNERFQKKFSFRPLIGHRIGLGSAKNCTMIYDYIKVYYLN
ncbi:hypothetical protein F0919_08175 [Taibaiella lutea]|uniref:Uncharacterized protein n=1 Tax=Taibaiella lutea TaxID=2608001 RepID=A0A5M6CH77_9BACT|nr:hypothetical protein [Taibaiella lutea]KAA5534588.1 hypothetical protein F0919_08175 [Taibaiella lutea]